ncbi:Nickel/cobalt transporter regulator [compost metagenome]
MGQHVSWDYSRSHYLRNWRAHDLPHPGRGRQWLRTDSAYLLVDNSSGKIHRVIRR